MSTYLSTKEAAKLYKVSEQRVRTLCRSGGINAKKIGNSWVIDSEQAKVYGLQKSLMLAEDHPAYEIKSSKDKPIALSFFSGAMGLDLGVEKAGFDIRLACEVDKYCRQTIELNKPNTALLGDINDYTAEDVLAAAGLTYNDDVDLKINYIEIKKANLEPKVERRP